MASVVRPNDGIAKGKETPSKTKYQMSNLKTQTNPNTQKPKFKTPIHVVFGICSFGICLPAIASLRQTQARRAGCLFAICYLSFVISLMSQYNQALRALKVRQRVAGKTQPQPIHHSSRATDQPTPSP